MKLKVYDIIDNPLPQLYLIKEFDVNKNDFKEDVNIVKIINSNLKMDQLDSEHIYALSLTYGLIPRGIIQVAVGKCDMCNVNIRLLAIGLLLTGAEQFICFHNHPGGNKIISQSDKDLTKTYRELGELLDINFLRHIMITQNHFEYCEDSSEKLPFS